MSLIYRADLDIPSMQLRTCIGQQLTGIRYFSTISSGLGAERDSAVHEVDLEVLFGLSSINLALSWDRDDVDEGISAARASDYDSAEEEGLVAEDMTTHVAWLPLIGREIVGVAVWWHLLDTESCETARGVKFTLRGGREVAVALGQHIGDKFVYHAESLLVIFDPPVTCDLWADQLYWEEIENHLGSTS